MPRPFAPMQYSCTETEKKMTLFKKLAITLEVILQHKTINLVRMLCVGAAGMCSTTVCNVDIGGTTSARWLCRLGRAAVLAQHVQGLRR